MPNNNTCLKSGNLRLGWKLFISAVIASVFLQSGYASGYQQHTNKSDQLAVQFSVLQDQGDEEMRITMKVKQIDLASALEILAEQLRVGLSYNTDIMPREKVTLDMSNAPVFEVLNKLLQGTNLEAVLPPTRDVIVIREKEIPEKLELYQRTVQGIVVDAQTNEALPGVNVVLQNSESETGSVIGTQTGLNGEYSLRIPDSVESPVLIFTYIGYQMQEVAVNYQTEINVSLQSDIQMLEGLVVVGYGVQSQERITGSIASVRSDLVIGTQTGLNGEYSLRIPDSVESPVLIFTYIGYQMQEVAVNYQTEINVSLQSDIQMLEGLVVVGYGVQSQERITGSIASVRSDALEGQPITDLSTALQGQASGVEIVRSGGDPGAAGTIRIRGTGTVNNADPLIVIDGMPSDVSSLNNINSDDVESIDVLKDASAAAIYGNRAANGVILVTTKGGSFNQGLAVRFNTSVGFSNPINTVDVLDAPTLAQLKRERYTNDGLPVNPIWENTQYQTQQTNWQKELLGTGTIQDYNLSLQGGSQNSSFYISGNFADEKGMMKSSYFDRYGLKINSNHRIGDRINLRQNLTLSRTSGNTLDTQSAQTGVLWSAIRFHPGLPVQYDDGSYSSSQISGEFGDINNPIFTVEEDSDANNERRRVRGNVQAELELLQGLSLRGNVGLDYQLNDFYGFNVIISDQIRARSRNSLQRQFTESTSVLTELFQDFNKTFGNDHDFDGLAGVVLEKANGESVVASRQDFANESSEMRVLDAGDSVYLAGGSK